MTKLEIRYLEIAKTFSIVFSNIVNLDEHLSYLENLENNNLKKEQLQINNNFIAIRNLHNLFLNNKSKDYKNADILNLKSQFEFWENQNEIKFLYENEIILRFRK